ncbi:hypothetical protein Droror1_Dr00025159 [Drosera rotundifolia]
MSMSFSTLQFCVILLLLTAVLCNGTQLNLSQVGECSSRNGNGTKVGEVNDLVPLIDDEKVEKMRIVMNETRRRLGSFQICAPCTCCGARGYCLPSPCCYAINCNIPNRPFGFCSFTPRTCYKGYI